MVRRVIWSMKKIMLVLMIIMIIPASALADLCTSIVSVGTNCTMVSPTISCANYSYTIINMTDGITVNQGQMAGLSTDIYYFNFTEKKGNYIVKLCDGTTREIQVNDKENGNMIIATIILLPMILALVLIIAAVNMSEEHAALKIFLFLLCSILFMTSLHFSIIAVVKYYDFPELQDVIGSTTYWFGWVFGIIISYFVLHILYGLFMSHRENEKQRLEY
jgi:hypothetical protein